MHGRAFFVSFCLITWLGIWVQASLINQSVNREIIVSNVLNVHSIEIYVRNQDPSPATEYTFALKTFWHQSLASFSVLDQDNNSLKYRVENPSTSKLQSKGVSTFESNHLYHVTLSQPLEPNEVIKLDFKLVFGPMWEVTPQGSQSKMDVVDSNHFLSPYTTEQCNGIIFFESPSDPISLKIRPHGARKFKFEQLKMVPPHSFSLMRFSVTTYPPFLIIPRLEREVQVSHWNKVSIRDHTEWKNNNAPSLGVYSKYEIVVHPFEYPLIDVVVLTLPENAGDVYHRDELGYIHDYLIDDRTISLKPRIHLLGGWKTSFVLGYDIPLSQVVKFNTSEPDQYQLTIPVGPAYKDAIWVEQEIIRILLPEGASNIRVQLPFEMKHSSGTEEACLDFRGRPVVILERTNLFNQQLEKNIIVYYQYKNVDLFFKPTLLMLVFLFILISISVLIRVDCGIASKMEGKATTYKYTLAPLLQEYKNLFASRLKRVAELKLDLQGGVNPLSIERLNPDFLTRDTNGKVKEILEKVDGLDQMAVKLIHNVESCLCRLQTRIFNSIKVENINRSHSRQEDPFDDSEARELLNRFNECT